MSKLEHKIRVVSGVAISLILSGAFLYVDVVVERVLQMEGEQPTVLSVRSTVIATAIVTCFLVMIANYLAVRVAIIWTARPQGETRSLGDSDATHDASLS